jgi:F-type H+-transporting ATPase subunit b
MAELHATIEQEREKARVAETRRNADDKRKMEISALRQACRFASRLLAEASGPDTQFRLVELLIEELSKLTPQRVEELRANYGHPPDVIVVVSAFPLAEDQRRQLEQTLTGITTADTAVRFEQNIELLAGVRITIGAWVLAASVLDELQGFMELAQDE